MNNLTVLCVLVRGHVEFTAEYVVRLKSMCSRVLDRPHRFVCLTDDKYKLPEGIDTLRIPTPKGRFAWWSKLELFNGAHGLTGRLLYQDPSADRDHWSVVESWCAHHCHASLNQGHH